VIRCTESGFQSAFNLKLAKLSAERVLTHSEIHTVGSATVKARDATEVCTGGHNK